MQHTKDIALSSHTHTLGKWEFWGRIGSHIQENLCNTVLKEDEDTIIYFFSIYVLDSVELRRSKSICSFATCCLSINFISCYDDVDFVLICVDSVF